MFWIVDDSLFSSFHISVIYLFCDYCDDGIDLYTSIPALPTAIKLHSCIRSLLLISEPFHDHLASTATGSSACSTSAATITRTN
jgi:hypothetical protein